MKISLPAVILTLTLVACERNSPDAANRTGKSPPNSPVIALTEEPTPPATVKNYAARGTITKINLEIGSVELDHEEIKGLMPAMRMEFYVNDPSPLRKLKVGDRVDFVLEEKSAAERIVSIKKR